MIIWFDINHCHNFCVFCSRMFLFPLFFFLQSINVSGFSYIFGEAEDFGVKYKYKSNMKILLFFLLLN